MAPFFRTLCICFKIMHKIGKFCMKCGNFILTKIIKFVATRCRLWRLGQLGPDVFGVKIRYYRSAPCLLVVWNARWNRNPLHKNGLNSLNCTWPRLRPLAMTSPWRHLILRCWISRYEVETMLLETKSLARMWTTCSFLNTVTHWAFFWHADWCQKLLNVSWTMFL